MSAFLCFQAAPNSKYDPQEDEYPTDGDMTKPFLEQQKKEQQQAVLIEQGEIRNYPGFSHHRTNLQGVLPPDHSVLIKTGGNALQAIPQSIVEDKSHHLIQVVVPDNNMRPGDTLLVYVPDGSGQTVAARIPEGCGPGSFFFVNATNVMSDTTVEKDQQQRSPQQPSSSSPLVVEAMPFADTDLEFTEEITNHNNNHQQVPAELVLVIVPEGSVPGDMIRVTLPDQRIVEATVPEGNISQFYVQAPPRGAVSERHTNTTTNHHTEDVIPSIV